MHEVYWDFFFFFFQSPPKSVLSDSSVYAEDKKESISRIISLVKWGKELPWEPSNDVTPCMLPQAAIRAPLTSVPASAARLAAWRHSRCRLAASRLEHPLRSPRMTIILSRSALCRQQMQPSGRASWPHGNISHYIHNQTLPESQLFVHVITVYGIAVHIYLAGIFLYLAVHVIAWCSSVRRFILQKWQVNCDCKEVGSGVRWSWHQNATATQKQIRCQVGQTRLAHSDLQLPDRISAACSFHGAAAKISRHISLLFLSLSCLPYMVLFLEWSLSQGVTSGELIVKLVPSSLTPLHGLRLHLIYCRGQSQRALSTGATAALFVPATKKKRAHKFRGKFA